MRPSAGPEAEEQQEEQRAAEVALRVVDPLAVVLVRALRGELLGDDLWRPFPDEPARPRST